MNLLARFDFLVVTILALLLKRIFKNLFIAIIRPGQHIAFIKLKICHDHCVDVSVFYLYWIMFCLFIDE